MRLNFLLLAVILSISQQIFANDHLALIKTKANSLATGLFKARRQHPWPFPLISIGNIMQSYQDYSGSPYWHDGLDIRSREEQPIYASVGGKVVNIENYVAGNSLYWEVAILDDEGLVWKYHHVERKSIPAEIYQAFKTGKKIATGELIGKVVKWPVVSYEEVYHHLHLLIVGADGKYINPFLLLTPLEDNQAPVIHRIGLTQKHRPLDVTTVRGAYGLFVEASDLILHHKYLQPPHRISYRLNQGELKEVWAFNHLPSGTNDVDYIRDFYLTGTCGNYQCRKFFINLNFSPDNPRSLFKSEPGEYEVEVIVEDAARNQTSSKFKWTVL